MWLAWWGYRRLDETSVLLKAISESVWRMRKETTMKGCTWCLAPKKTVKRMCEVREVENHRLVISVPAHGKLLEKIIEPSICSHLENNKEETRTALICQECCVWAGWAPVQRYPKLNPRWNWELQTNSQVDDVGFFVLFMIQSKDDSNICLQKRTVVCLIPFHYWDVTRTFSSRPSVSLGQLYQESPPESQITGTTSLLPGNVFDSTQEQALKSQRLKKKKKKLNWLK